MARLFALVNLRYTDRPKSEEFRMKRKGTDLAFCVLRVVLPYWQFLPWVVAQPGAPPGLFLRELFATRIGGFFGIDVLVSSVVLIFFVVREGKRLGVGHRWVPIVATLTVGVSAGFPLFLYLREGDAAGTTLAVASAKT